VPFLASLDEKASEFGPVLGSAISWWETGLVIAPALKARPG
jgi:hypothetical protein